MIYYFSYNARWNSRVVVKNPSFWELCKKMWEAFEDTSYDIGRLSRDPPVRITREAKIKNVINRETLRKAERELENGGTVMAFLRKARHTFGNANKKYFTKLLEAIENDAELGGDIQEEEDEEAAVQVQVQQQPTGGEDQEAQNGGQIQINRCVICMDRKPEVVLAPCGHHNICAPCAPIGDLLK